MLEKCRGANQFNQDASWTQTLQACGSLNSLLNAAAPMPRYGSGLVHNLQAQK
ncbi:MAG TPA: hypothetical protein VI278_15055 [Nitrososphaeraceae archaeon]